MKRHDVNSQSFTQAQPRISCRLRRNAVLGININHILVSIINPNPEVLYNHTVSITFQSPCISSQHSIMSNMSTSPEKQSLIPQLNPPLPTASPSEVRAFITELLILTRNLPAQHAKEIADKWHLGTGRELTTYPPSVYADIFGSEDAWMVYKESQLFIRRARQEKNRRQDVLRKCRFAISLKISLLCSALSSSPSLKRITL